LYFYPVETKTGNIFFERISVFGNESFFSEYATGFRFGFNGKEKTDELYGTGNAYDYGMRMYDARLGRFMSTDPLFKKYPELSTYQFASNRPIEAIDLDGKEALDARGRIYEIDGGSDIGTADRLIIHGEELELASVIMMGGGTTITFFSDGAFGPQLFRAGADVGAIGGGMKATGEYMNKDYFKMSEDLVFVGAGLGAGKQMERFSLYIAPATTNVASKIEVLLDAPLEGISYGLKKAIDSKQSQSNASTTNSSSVNNSVTGTNSNSDTGNKSNGEIGNKTTYVGTDNLYTIKKGETLSSIAKSHKTTVSALHEANQSTIKNVDKIQAGQEINLKK